MINGVKHLPIEGLSQDKFDSYGRILTPSDGERPEVSEPEVFDFFLLFKMISSGWQIGYLTIQTKQVDSLERHPNTPEVFVPLRGKAAIIASNDPNEDTSLHAFHLREPVVLRAGVWHNVVHIAGEVSILIIEGVNVIDDYFALNYSIQCDESTR